MRQGLLRILFLLSGGSMKGCVFLNYLENCRDQVVEVKIKRRRSYGRVCYVID